MKISKKSQIIVCTVFGVLLISVIIIYYTVPSIPESIQNLLNPSVPFDSLISIPPPKSFVSLTTPPPSLPPAIVSPIPQSTPPASTDAIIIINSDPSEAKALYIGVAPVPLQKCSSQVMQYPSILIASILFTDGMEFTINPESPVSVLILSLIHI